MLCAVGLQNSAVSVLTQAVLGWWEGPLWTYPVFKMIFINQSSFPSIQGKNSKKSHCFPPMNRDHRRIIHDLAQVYGLESVSYDSEPKRNVVVTAVRWVNLAITEGTAQWSKLDLGNRAGQYLLSLLPSLEDEVEGLPLGQPF